MSLLLPGRDRPLPVSEIIQNFLAIETAINELKSDIEALPGAPTDLDAADISFTSSGSTLTSNDVSSALDELQTNIDNVPAGGGSSEADTVVKVEGDDTIVYRGSNKRMQLLSSVSRFSGVSALQVLSSANTSLQCIANLDGAAPEIRLTCNGPSDPGFWQLMMDNNSLNRFRMNYKGALTFGLRPEGGAEQYVNDPDQYGWVMRKNGTRSGPSTYMDFRENASSVGSLTWDGATFALNSLSDRDAKENIVDAQSAGNQIDAIMIRSFDFKSSGQHVDHGVIAQELHEVCPEAVSPGYDEEDDETGEIRTIPWQVNTTALIPLLIKEIQDLRARVSELET